MKTISSQAGTRLARARKSEREAVEHWYRYQTEENRRVWEKCSKELDCAGRAVADELVAQGFADAEGDDE